MRDAVMSAITVGIVGEVAGEAIHRSVDWKTVRVVMFPVLAISGRQYARALGERVLAKRNVLVGRRLHDVSIEDVGVQDSCIVVVVKVGRVFRVGLNMMLVERVKLVLDRRVCWACLLVREPVACSSSKGHAGAEQVDKCTSVQTVTVRAGDRGCAAARSGVRVTYSACSA